MSQNEKDKLVLGLDIGVTSVGWSIINLNKNKIEDLGVRIFPLAENPKDGSSLNQIRREKRSIRRITRRRKQRLDNIKNIFIKHNLLTDNRIKEIQNIKEERNPYYYRMKGLDFKLTLEDLFSAVYHIAKKRGYKSNRKEKLIEEALRDESKIENKENKASLAEVKKQESRQVLKALTEMEKILKDSKARTIGEYLFKLQYKITVDSRIEKNSNIKIRNESGSYRFSFARAKYEEEMNMILDKQIEFGLINQGFKNEIIKKAFYQRSFAKLDQIEKMVGKCQFEKDELRAPKATLTFQEFVLWQNLHNNTKLKDKENGERELSLEEKNKIFKKCFDSAKVTYAQIRKELELPPTAQFCYLGNYRPKKAEEVSSLEELNKGIENKTFFEAKSFNKIKKIFDFEYNELTLENKKDVDELARILTVYKDEEACKKELINFSNSSTIKINEKQLKNLLGLEFDGYGNLSLKAIYKILPLLSQNMKYTDACDKLSQTDESYKMWGSNKSRSHKLPVLPKDDRSITSPVVKRAVNQTRKVVNAVIDKYGELYEVHIELARDIAKNHSDRSKIERQQKENEKINQEASEKLRDELGIPEASKRDLLKYKLYKQQEGKCLYSGKKIELNMLNSDGYVQVDHVIPFSRSADDSVSNKALVLTSENQDKGNRTPYEWFGQDEKRWDEYVGRVETFYKGNDFYTKRNKLATKKYSIEGMKERMLNDTRYATRFLKNYIENNLNFADSEDGKRNRQKVVTVNGITTSYLRKRFGLRKIREGGDVHHALDATIVAICTPSYIQKIAKFEKALPLHKNSKYWEKILDPETNENFEKDEELMLFMKQTDKFFSRLPDPWNNFKRELEIRMLSNISDQDKKELLEKNKSYTVDDFEKIKPIFVSRMPRRGVTGALHEDTLRSLKILNKTGENKTFETVRLGKLTLEKLENSLVKETDKFLYKILKNRLLEHDNDPEKAFKESVKKGNSENSPLVKSVKVYKDGYNSYIELNNGKTSAENGDMVRVDIYEKNAEKGKYKGRKQYYARLWYAYHVKSGKEPTKLCTALKPESEWLTLDNSFNFKTSLFKNDLLYIKDDAKNKELLCYFNGFHRGTNNLEVTTHDNSVKIPSVAILNLDTLEKFQVDILGSYYKSK